MNPYFYSSNAKQDGSPRSSISHFSETDSNINANQEDVQCRNLYSSSDTKNMLNILNSQVKLLEAQLKHEKLDSDYNIANMKNHYKLRIGDLEGRLVASEAKNSKVEELEGRLQVFEEKNVQMEAEKNKLETAYYAAQNKLQTCEYKIHLAELKQDLYLKFNNEDAENKRYIQVSQQLHDEKIATKNLKEELAVLKLNKKELKKLVEIKESSLQKVDEELLRAYTENKQLKKRHEEMEEQRKNNYLNKHRQTQAQIDKCVADTKEKHQKEMAEYKEEVREKHFQEMSTLKEELRQTEQKNQHILLHAQQSHQYSNAIFHNELTKTKQELSNTIEHLRQAETVYQRQLAVNEQSYLQINEEHQKELSESRKQLDKLRQEFITVNAEHAKELENTRTKADEVIHKLERDLTETKTGMTDALENLAKVREESAEASARHLKELEVARKEADKAIQKVQQEQMNSQPSKEVEKLTQCISETLARKREMEVLVLEFKAKSSTAQKDITELKRKSREMADKLESTYIAKNKLKFDLESKLAAVTEKYQNATEQNLSIEKESAFPPVVNKQHQNLASSAIPDTPNNTKNQILADHPAPTSTESNIVIRTPDTPVLGSTFATCLTPPAKHSRSNKLKRMSCTPSQSPEKMTKAPRNDKGDKKEEEKVSKAVPEQEKDNDCEIVYVATKKKSSQISSSYLGLNLEIRPL